MKKIILVLTLSIFLFFPNQVFAHILKTSGNIGVTLHIDPGDDPIAGEQSNFFFEIKDKTGKFKPEDCNCGVTIMEGDKQIYTGSISNGALSFTFPQKGVYKVTLTGTPNIAGQFEQFNISYDVRVDKEVDSVNQNSVSNPSDPTSNWVKSHVIHLVGGFLVLGFFIFALIKQNRDAKKS